MKAGEKALGVKVTELVILAKSGNADAFGELYGLYNKEMYQYACCMVKNPSIAEDAVSETVLSAFREIGSLRNPDSFKGWIFRILNNTCKRLYNQQFDFIELNTDIDHSSSDSGGIDKLDLSMELQSALSTISFEERQIVYLHVVLEYKSHEIAEILNLPASTVRSKLKRALKKLRDNLNENNYDGKEDD